MKPSETMRLCLVGWLLSGFFVGVRLQAEVLTMATYNIENYVSTNRMTEAGYR